MSTPGSAELDNDDSDSSSVSDDDGYVSTSTITSPELKMIKAHAQVYSISKGTHSNLFLICLIISSLIKQEKSAILKGLLLLLSLSQIHLQFYVLWLKNLPMLKMFIPVSRRISSMHST